MKTPHLPLLLTVAGCGIVAWHTSPLHADEPAEAIVAMLEQASVDFNEAMDAADDGLTDSLTSAIEIAKKRGRLDDVELLQAARLNFTEDGIVPLGPTRTLKVLAVRYQFKTKRAVSKLTMAYEKAVKDYTKAGDLERAKETDVELRAMLGQVEPDPPEDFKSLAGDWVLTYGTSGKTFYFTISATGKHANGQIEIRNGRYLEFGDGSHQDTEYIRRGPDLIVLGWTARDGRSPLYEGNNPLMSQPDHVGIARRVVKQAD